MRWLPWLVAALIITWVLWPNPITASHLAFQSIVIFDRSPVPEDAAPPAPLPEPDTGAQPAVPDSAPPDVGDAPPAVEQPPPVEPAPGEPAVPVEPPPAEQPVPVEPAPGTDAPAQPQPPAIPATEMPRVPTRAVPSDLLIDQPPRAPQPGDEPAAPAGPGIGQSVINWSKFWDTIVVVVAYPWLCCGILLLLGLPLGLLLLEIKGQRRPRKLPELPGHRQPPPSRNPEL